MHDAEKTMDLTIVTFGRIADITGAQFTIDEAGDTDELRQQLDKRFPLLKGTKYMIAVNKKMITGKTVLQPGMVIALMPPFSGG